MTSRFLSSKTVLSTALSLAAWVPGLAFAATYQVTDLGALPGYATSTATSINERGDVVGYCSPTREDMNQRAFVWRQGSLTDLGALPGGNYSLPTSINAQGVIVGDGDTGNFRPQSWVTRAGGLFQFFPNNGGNTHALFVSDSGWIGGYYTKSLGGWTSSWKGAIWSADPKKPDRLRVIDLPVLPGGINRKATASFPAAFNQKGQAAGYAQTDVIGQHACFWNNNATHSIVDLGVFPGDSSSVAEAINDHGQVAGTSHPAFGSRAVIWNNDANHTVAELALLPGDNYGGAYALNNLGHALGYSAYGVPGTWDIGPAQIVIWRDGSVFPLQSLVDANSGWVITQAAALNHQGQIVGQGTRNGQTHALLLTPQP
ncbi:MAG: hypothetical protein J0M24_18730 [Verrucomicrobia bacterium]|nr:hypothetical protein [Verrucomicrobiota bacterium]